MGVGRCCCGVAVAGDQDQGAAPRSPCGAGLAGLLTERRGGPGRAAGPFLSVALVAPVEVSHMKQTS